MYICKSTYTTTKRLHKLVKDAGNHSSGGEVTGEKEPATEPRTLNLCSNAQFSDTSHRTGPALLSPIAPYVTNTGVSPIATA